jgi:hypothetical protein
MHLPKPLNTIRTLFHNPDGIPTTPAKQTAFIQQLVEKQADYYGLLTETKIYSNQYERLVQPFQTALRNTWVNHRLTITDSKESDYEKPNKPGGVASIIKGPSFARLRDSFKDASGMG